MHEENLFLDDEEAKKLYHMTVFKCKEFKNDFTIDCELNRNELLGAIVSYYGSILSNKT